jgi:1-acyl-sn-glycerol-3-phosphate acyltransferase
VHAVCPEARFVAKAEVGHWPLIGRLVDAGGTLYIERERKRDALRVVHAMAEALDRGDTVAVFPEGTTGDGAALLPFHANLLQAAIAARVPVQPLALRYAEPGAPVSLAAQWIGDTTLVQSLWRLARARGLSVTVQVLPAERCDHADRRRLADHLATQITLALAGTTPAGPTDLPAASPASTPPAHA